MARYEDLTGRKFGMLTVLEPTEKKTADGRRIWKCLCDCGNIKFTTCQNLKRGHCTSCGCKNLKQITALGHSRAANLIGKRFGKLTVTERSYIKLPYSDSVTWICKCDCGRDIITTTSALNSGNTKSCGHCIKSYGEESIAQILIKANIKFIREYVIQELKSPLGRPLRFDFYLPTLNCLIEYDGEQHYSKLDNKYASFEQYSRDCSKNKFCLDHNIKLYRIPYAIKDDLENKQLDELLDDKYLVKEINHYHLKKYPAP